MIHNIEKGASFSLHNLVTFHILENTFIGPKRVVFNISKLGNFSINENTFEGHVDLTLLELQPRADYSIKGNNIEGSFFLEKYNIPHKASFGWTQLEGKIIDANEYFISYYSRDNKGGETISYDEIFSDSEIQNYLSNYRVESEETYEKETSIRYDLYTFYKSQYQIDNANEVYREIKDLQTDRLKYI
jgi:hypothetical protein